MSLKLRRNLHLVLKLALFAVILIAALGNQRIISYSLQDSGSPLAQIAAIFSSSGQAAAASPVQAATAVPVQNTLSADTQEAPAAAGIDGGAQLDSPVNSQTIPSPADLSGVSPLN